MKIRISSCYIGGKLLLLNVLKNWLLSLNQQIIFGAEKPPESPALFDKINVLKRETFIKKIEMRFRTAGVP
jgi:hypothetical protein